MMARELLGGTAASYYFTVLISHLGALEFTNYKPPLHCFVVVIWLVHVVEFLLRVLPISYVV